jgi:hypothetical protein
MIVDENYRLPDKNRNWNDGEIGLRLMKSKL